jgi:hypothetical protein
MYSKDNLQWRRKLKTRWLNCGVAAALVTIATWVVPSRAAVLMEEAFNYPAGTLLAADSPWVGTANGALSVVAGNLSVTNLRGIFPSGNQLQLNGATTASARRNFATTAISNNVYCSFLINCTTAPTNQQFIVSLLRPGAASASPPDDPVDVYVRPSGGGYAFTLTSVGSDPSTSGTVLMPNTTHLIVIKYTFGGLGLGSLYIDPVPGGTEPFPNITAGADDNVGPTSLQVLLFRSASGPAAWSFDTVRVGTNWSDVVPAGVPLTITGPQDQAICSGNPASFSVAVDGTPPFLFQWRTNGIAVAGATNNTFLLPAPGPGDASNFYDVVVQDSFTIATSQVAHLTISSVPAAIKTQPANVIVTPASTNAVFTVEAGGDAPLSYQWRTNGVPVVGATNNSYTITNPATVDPSLQYDVIISNPCGTITSAPPVMLVFPSVFYAAYDAGPGFFSGENLVLTNGAGLALQAWSSASLSVPITGWTPEGLLQEQPLNDGSGKSFYSINVNPAASPTYYIFGASVSAPYLAPIPILAITLDPSGFYFLTNSPMPISPNGVLGVSAPQLSVAPHSGGGWDLTGTGIAGNTYLLQMTTDISPVGQWITVQTNVADPSGVVRFSETNGPEPMRFYRLLGQ